MVAYSRILYAIAGITGCNVGYTCSDWAKTVRRFPSDEVVLAGEYTLRVLRALHFAGGEGGAKCVRFQDRLLEDNHTFVRREWKNW
jgi:hypothetical protein